ncbi:YbaB/EbfC family nucleoid-associated protein [Nocardia sp. NPDC058658]|uniref:YbaB/EbfC family nucleoid-associated protein n=1 Tax=Nocardia sp. NPDC058658 TaxID=3346580 RepID=UPI0036526C3B
MDDLNNAAAEMSRWADDLEAKARRYQELHTTMSAVSVTDTSADGRISVTVDANGSTTAITLAAAVRGMDPTAVATELMACTHRAQARLREQVTGLVQDIVGDDEAGAAIVGQYTDRFPDLDPTSSAPPAAPVARWHSGPAAPVAPWPSEPGAPATRKPDRDRVVAPAEPSEEDLFYQRKSWLQ